MGCSLLQHLIPSSFQTILNMQVSHEQFFINILFFLFFFFVVFLETGQTDTQSVAGISCPPKKESSCSFSNPLSASNSYLSEYESCINSRNSFVGCLDPEQTFILDPSMLQVLLKLTQQKQVFNPLSEGKVTSIFLQNS